MIGFCWRRFLVGWVFGLWWGSMRFGEVAASVASSSARGAYVRLGYQPAARFERLRAALKQLWEGGGIAIWGCLFLVGCVIFAWGFWVSRYVVFFLGWSLQLVGLVPSLFCRVRLLMIRQLIPATPTVGAHPESSPPPQ